MVILDKQGFSQYLLLNERRNTTIKRHLNALSYLSSRLDEFSYPQVSSLLATLKEQGKSNAYLNTLINSVRLYAQFKVLAPELQRYHQFNKTTSIKSTMSDAEIETFLGLFCPFHADAKRWQIYTVFWSIIAFTGMRPGECAKLKASDIDFGRGIIQIRTSKTNQPGVVPIPANITPLITGYLTDKEAEEYLFPSKLGGAHYSAGGEAVIDNVDWHYDWKKRIKLIGLKRNNLTPYSLRHSYATRLLEENVSLFHVKKLMRHSDLKSTLVYEHLTTKDLIEAQQKLPLVRRGTDPRKILRAMGDLVKGFRIEEDNRFTYQVIEDETSIEFKCCIKDKKNLA